MSYRHLLLLTPVALALQACSGDSNYDFDANTAANQAEVAATQAPSVLFDPANAVLPFPNSLLFTGSVDGTLNAPVADATDLSDPRVALNQMDGFSTTAPISVGVSKPVDPATLVVGDTVRVFEVSTDAASGAVTGITGELGATEVFATATDTQVAILPLQPLKASTDYLVILTRGIADTSGQALDDGIAYTLTKSTTPLTGDLAALEPLRQLTGTMLAAAATQSIEASSVVASWTFKTQSIREILQAAEDQAGASPLVVAPSGSDTSAFNPALAGKADVYIGTLDVPYYQSAPVDGNPLVALNSHWQGAGGSLLSRFNPNPVATGTQTIPVMLTLPNANSAGGGSAPAAGWPIVIFQHGITRNRTDMLAIADAMADAGLAVIGIDLPMHGLVDTTLPVHAANTPFPTDGERTFGIDVLNNETNAAGPDGVADLSGIHFYNLANLANARDNLRQGVADLFTLSQSLATLQGAPIDASQKHFVGHSLGGIVGTTFLSYDDSVTTATLAMPGGGLAQLLANSGSFGETIANGVAGAAGLTVDDPAFPATFAQFLGIAQTVIDSGDPINHAATLAGNGTAALHMIEVIGDGTIPNSVAAAPLSGTEPLARQLGLSQVVGTIASGGLVKFSEGDHGSILNPEASAAATVEMQKQTVTFAASQGTVLPIDDTSVIDGASGE